MRFVEALKGVLLTKLHVGLGNVDDTADIDKPVSTAQSAADAAVAATAAGGVSTHAGLTAAHGATGAVVGTTNAQTLTNKTLTSPAITTPTGIVKGDVGLGSVDNTADTAKPVSTAQQTALDGKLTIPAGSDTNLLQRQSGLWVPRTIAQVMADMAFQPLDSDLTTLASLSATTDNMIQSVASTWVSRTPLQVKTTLELDKVINLKHNSAGIGPPTVSSDSSVGYSFGSLWSDATNKTYYVCMDAAPGAAVWRRLQFWDTDLDTIAGLTATTDNMIQSVGSAWESRTPAQVRTALALVPGTNVQAYDADLATIAGLTATSDSFMQAKGSAWSSRTVAQVRSDLTIALNNVGATSNPLATDDSIAGYGVGSVWLNTTTDRAYICLDSTMAAAVWRMISLSPTLRLDYGSVADVTNGGSFTAGIWTSLISSQAFTNGGASGSWLYIEVLLGMIGQAGALTQWALRLTFDTGQSTYEFCTGLAFPSPNYGSLNGHTFFAPNFLAAGSRAVTVQVLPLSSNVTAYCRPTTQPNMEQLQIRIVEWIP